MMPKQPSLSPSIILLLLIATGVTSHANELRIVSGTPADQRLQSPKDLNGYFPFNPPKSAEAWQKRAAQANQQSQPQTQSQCGHE